MAKRKKNKGRLAAALICLFMAAATLLRGGQIDLPAVSDALGEVSDAVSDLSQTPAEPVDGLFEMIALDVGQGDSFLLRTQEQSVLIDTGEAEYADTVVGALKEYGVEQLDLVIATHMHSDHMGGMAEVLEAVPAKTFIMTELPENLTPTSRVYENLLTALEQSPETEVIPAQPGDRYSLGDGVTLTILGPVADYDDLNLTSVVCRVDAGDRSFLFTGDMEKKAENDLIAAGADLSADVLKVGHHGASTSSTADFLAEVDPVCSVISVGEGNSYGHPTAATLERLNKYGPVYRTDLLGEIRITTDGVSLWMESDNGEPEQLL